MKIIVATKKTQGQRANDFCFVEEGEILKFGFQCDNGYDDDGCGCHRSMIGTTKSSATTTMEIVDRKDLTIPKLTKILQDSFARDGWGELQRRDAVKQASLLLQLAEKFPVGTILERRDEGLRERIHPSVKEWT